LPRALRRTLFVVILLSIAVRFVNIDSTVIGWHSWRQADTAALARNFHDSGEGILYPRADWGGGGYVETEFQAYTYLVSLMYGIVGVHEAIGRLISVLFSILAIAGVYFLARRFYDENVGLIASTVYAVLPLTMFYGRAFMPESMMLSLIIWGLYFFDRWRESQQWTDMSVAWVLLTLAVLLKIPTLYIGMPLLFIASTHGGGLLQALRSLRLWLFAAALVAATALWYAHAYSLFLQTGNTFGIWTGSTNKWGEYDSLLTVKFYNDILFKSIAERHLTWPGTVLLIGGLFVRRASRREWFAEWWMLAVLVYFLVVNKGNQVHEYYQLPFIPPAAIVIARMLEALRAHLPRLQRNARRFAATMSIVLIAALLLLSGMRYNALLAGERDSAIIEFAAMAQRRIPDDAKVLTVGDGNPLLLYLLHRKGWIVNSGTITDVDQRPPYLMLPPDADSYLDSGAMRDLITGASVLHEHRGYRLLER
jgi:4-amino-4-deoxy-L-arabinose transferase-like glycosyltransferase